MIANRIILLLSVICLLRGTSCAQRNMEGGSCSYKTTKYPAVIIMIYDVDSVHNDMFLATHVFGEIDTVSFHSRKQEYFTNQELKDMNYKVGDTLTLKHMDITSGHCTPHIVVLSKERYRK